MTLANWVRQTTTGTGTGNLTLSSQTGFDTFSSAFGTGAGNPFRYSIRHTTAGEREFGTGYMSDSTTLVRNSVITSTNSDSLVNFSAGTKEVICSPEATDLQVLSATAATGDIIYNNGTSWTNLARGTNGQVLNSTATTIAWADASGGVWQLLGSTTASGAAQVDFSVFDAAYDYYKIVGINITSTAGVALLYLRTSSDGGSTFESGSSDYRWVNSWITSGTSTASISSDTLDSEITLSSTNLGGASPRIAHVEIDVHDPLDSGTATVFKWSLGAVDVTSENATHIIGAGHRKVAAVTDAVRILTSAGGSDMSGEFYVYGAVKS